MTNQNNAAQAAPQQAVLTRKQIGELYKGWACVFGVSTGSAELCIREIEAAVLSALRAPVADEDNQPTAPDDDAIAECWVTASDCDGIAYDGPSFERGYRLGEIAERDRAALASAPVATPGNTLTGDGSGVALPVAGEAPPTDWQNALRIAELPEVDEALAVFCNDDTLDNAVGLVQAILDAAPQVSDGVLPAPCHDLRYHDQYRIGWNRCLDACRAALAAQPAEKPATSAPSPVASQRQAMIPASRESGNSHTDGGAVYE